MDKHFELMVNPALAFSVGGFRLMMRSSMLIVQIGLDAVAVEEERNDYA